MRFLATNRKLRQIIAMILAAVVFLGVWPNVTVPVRSEDAVPEQPYVAVNEEKVSQVVLEDDGKLRFEAVTDLEVAYYQWQIKDPAADDRWINISGGSAKYQWVTYALVGSMLAGDGAAQLRCKLTVNNEIVYTETVKVILSLKVTDPAPEEEPASLVGPMLYTARPIDEELTTYSIVINYLFDNNAIAFESYGATVAAGSDFKESIKSPTIVGYAPFRRMGDEYVSAEYVNFDLTNIQQDITINVIYEPALVDFAVHHHLQNILDDDYSVNYDLITYSKALTGSVVGEGLALTEAQLPGFKALAYEKLTVAADGSTIIEIRYDRNYYLVDFDMNGGYGTEPVYTRYGAAVGANNPIRHGYVFDGWELVSYGGQTPTAEQKSKYDLRPGQTINVPDANLRYQARWITQETTYTLVFWCEDADGPGYSYWGYLDNVPAMSGSYVSAEDRIAEVTGIDDEQYFTFNYHKSDKNVLVEGDGSTVVNVYYTRDSYILTFKATGKCTIEANHTHNDTCYETVCGKGHTHTEECVPQLTCPTPEHTEHTADCIICGIQEHIHGQLNCECNKAEHTHSISCWNNVGNLQNNFNSAPKNPVDGQIQKSGTRSYIYIAGSWYRYTGRNASTGDVILPVCNKDAHKHGQDCDCSKEQHLHDDNCYRDVLHTHEDSCYTYSCGAEEHVHDDRCLRLVCTTTENHKHSNTCNSSSGTNVVKVVRAKYNQNIEDLWPVTDDNGNTYDSGERWKPSNSEYYTQVLVFISQMPPDDFTLTIDKQNYKTYTMNYYLQVLPGEPYDVTYEGKQYKLGNTIVAIYNFITEAEDFFDIKGFTQYESDPAFGSNGQISTNGNAMTVDFFYDRTKHNLEFNNNGLAMDDKAVHGVLYDALINDYKFTPEYPSNLEPNAYEFGGWYTSPGCFKGTEVNWDTMTMPDGNLLLYAKWVPVTHTVRVFKDATLTEQIGQDQLVDHKAFASSPAGNITNGNYVFQGWFYMDEVNGIKVEKAFAFHGIPVVEDMDIYAKWSSHVTVEYKINYKLFNTDTDIADPTVGNAIAGHNKTFDAKAGSQLYGPYQTGYYPLTNSHTITMSVDGTHEFTFYYVYVENMPYKVRYIDVATGNSIMEDKIVMDNTLSVVTETFQRCDKMMPDAYQKRLVLSADNTDADNDGIFDANVITFYYNSDEEHAYYRVVHYIQNMEGNTYREYRSEELTGLIGQSYTVSALTLTGFAFNGNKTLVNGVPYTEPGTTVTATLGAEGMLIELYYDRLVYDYVVRYVDSHTNLEIYPEKPGSGVFGQQIVEYAENLEAMGYELVSDSAKTHTISANLEHNVIIFHYQEMNVALKYQIVGPEGCGVLSQYSENLTAITGKTNGSEPLVSAGFVFLGWYTDADCTMPVEPAWVDAQTNRIRPQRTGDVWTDATYYAKIAALETELTLTTKSTAAIDADQVFIFHIKGKEGTDTADIDLKVTVIGNSSTTITGLPTGEYTVTELTDWSWRYENDTAQRQITLEYNENGTELIFDNSREEGKWLDGNAVKDNLF